MMKIKVVATVTIILDYITMDDVIKLADYLDANTDKSTKIDWFKIEEEKKYGITCSETGYVTYYPGFSYYEQDDWDYDSLNSEDTYAEIIRNYENENNTEFKKIIKDLEIEEI